MMKSGILENKDLRDIVRDRVLSFIRRRKGAWEGTMTELLSNISTGRQLPEYWPGSGASLRRIINPLLPAIRRAGFRVEFSRTTDHGRTRIVSFRPVTRKQ